MIYVFLSILALFLYLSTLSNTIYGGDAGDLVSAILTKGFPHPPGYPLYTILGRISNNISFFSLTPAGKVTLISLFSTSLSLIIVYLIIKILAGKSFNSLLALSVVLTLMVNYLVWLYAIVPEVFPLNVLIILVILLTSLMFKNTGKLKWLMLCFLLIGLGISHHHTFILILPSVYILVKNQLKKIGRSLNNIVLLILSFIIGLFSLLYLPIITFQHPEIIWGKADNLAGFIALLTRQSYGTFVAGQFITMTPIHRFIQLLNLFFFTLNDFTIIGLIFILIGFIFLFKTKQVDRSIKLALFLALFLFGLFFFFYANFPLRDKFDLATVERFMLVFYFLLAIPYYFGLRWFFLKLTQLIKQLVRKPSLFTALTLLILFIIPLGLLIKNYRRLILLKKTEIAEKLGRDVLRNAQSNSIVLLSGDTMLFNTQYVFYGDKNNYKDKIVIQASKITADYYRESLKLNYPTLIFNKKNSYTLGNFINDNVKDFTIYSNDKYSLPSNFPYKWITQGLLFRLVPKDYNNSLEIEKTIQSFWNTAENKDLANYYLKNRSHWLNYFPNDILKIYATAHQNTAFYFLNIDQSNLALFHINQSLILNPDDLDGLFLQSIYYSKINDCRQAEKSIIKAIDMSKDKLYLFQLEQLQTCFKDETDKSRIRRLLQQYNNEKIPLKSF